MCKEQGKQKNSESKSQSKHLIVDSQPSLSHEVIATRHTLMVRVSLSLIRFYRRYLSPLKPPSCRFTPTCSQYALDAYSQLGFFIGTWRTFTRILRCHPWHAGGHDPVIKNAKKSTKKKK
ncbi:MAG: membrane protein insertion efficiency factor YidD [Myxococcales bacterium]|nr:membrane protein insertion efficiency factor YidD [Myxococcales bacterium]